jgi:two-component system, LytTR family, response regulator
VIRVLVVDDEAPARRKMRKLLGGETGFEVVGEAADGDEAVRAVLDLGPELVFLDIQMPRRDGFAVVEAIGVERMPLVVFVTAYDEHALRAFEVHAFDYLLKPFAAKRFREVLTRVRRRLEEPVLGDLGERLEKLLAEARPSPRYLSRILLDRSDERQILMPVERIDLIRAERNYLRFVTREGELLRRGTLRELGGRLDPERFLRINRSEIVRLDAIAEISPWFHGDYRIRLHDGTELSWSRRYRARAKAAF